MIDLFEISSIDIYSASTEELESWIGKINELKEESDSISAGLYETSEAIEDELRIRGA